MARGTARKTAASDTVRGEYSSGTGFEPGNRAPSTKYVDEDGKVTDKAPTGVGRVLVFEGDTVHPHIAQAIKDGTYAVAGARLDNENSPGDHSNRRGPNADADDAATTDAGVDDDDES